MKRSIVLAALALGLAVADGEAAVEAGFESIFNGRNLDGWRGNPDLWQVQDGAITGITRADPKLGHNTFLVYTKENVGDFELRFSYRIVNGNSGVQYRSAVKEEGKFGPIVGGYQADFEAGTRYSGILYEERGRGILAERGQKVVIKTDGAKHKLEVVGSVGKTEDIQAKIKGEDWNEYAIIAQGNHLSHFINGMQTVDVVDEDSARAAKEGVLALQIHTGPPMVVQFKNLRIKKLTGAKAAPGGVGRLNGRWKAAEGEAGEGRLTEEQLATTVAFRDGKYDVDGPNGRSDGELEFVDGGTVSALVVRPKSGEYAGQTVHAIYELKGDTLRICYSLEARPKTFSLDDGGQLMVTYRRIKD